jgi:regulator of protease activity HflC (stomatin/prohibitin superfamily)
VVASDAGEADETDLERTDGIGPINRQAPVSVYFMSAAVPFDIRISNFYNFYYLHEDAIEAFRSIARAELTRFFVSRDFNTILTQDRAVIGRELKRNVQRLVDQRKLGIDVVFVGFQGLHPPVDVGEAFDRVLAKMQEKERLIVEAGIDAISKEFNARAQAIRIVSEAEKYKIKKENLPAAEAERFRQQLRAFKAAPNVFTLWKFLDVLESKSVGLRKYIIAAENVSEVNVFNFEEKLRPDMLDVDLTEAE